jgi:hypothetical protein
VTLGLTAPATFAQESFKNWNPRWSVLSSGISRAETSAEKSALIDAVENGTIDTRGTRVNVNNSDVERTGTGTRSVISNSKLRWHNPFSSSFDNPTSSRWYQKDGNTQVFRVFPGDENMSSARVGAGRSEAYAPNLGIRVSDNKTMTFSARYRVHAHNGSKDVKIFQSKATAAGGFDPAWGPALWVEADGDVVIVKRRQRKSDWVRIDTGKDVGDSFNFRVTDDGLNYKVFIDNVKMADDSWDRGNLKSVARWGAYVQGGSNGVLEGLVSDPQIIFISGARVTVN